jgi:hypothetical protein
VGPRKSIYKWHPKANNLDKDLKLSHLTSEEKTQ